MRWLCLLILCAIGCGEQPTPAATSDGPRIVSLSPAASIMLQAAGLEASIVGRHGWDAVLDQSLPVAGDQTGLDYERLITLDPTHVVIEWGARELPARFESLVAERDIDVVSIETLSLENIAESWTRITSAFDVEESSLDVSAFRQQSEPRDAWGTVLLVVATSPTIDCLGPGSAHHELLTLAGFSPALERGAPWVSLGLEDVIRLNPSCIVFIQPGGSDDAERALSDRLGPLAETDIDAVRLGRVVLIDDPTALIPSTNLVGIAAAMREGLAALGPLPSPP
ncbi:MAG: ABC transporter substrate-binding protein [Planctomycetota bacterium]